LLPTAKIACQGHRIHFYEGGNLSFLNEVARLLAGNISQEFLVFTNPIVTGAPYRKRGALVLGINSENHA
jgi:hypothetical protein